MPPATPRTPPPHPGSYPKALRIPERAFQDKVVAFARLQGWWVYHPWSSKHSEEGYPDLTLMRPPRIVFAELKGTGGKLTPTQEMVIGMLRLCEQEVFAWWPEDWDEVVRTLARDRPSR